MLIRIKINLIDMLRKQKNKMRFIILSLKAIGLNFQVLFHQQQANLVTHLDENAFLTKSELLARLQLCNLFRRDMQANELKIHRIERTIAAMAEVKNVDVFKHLGTSWEIKLELRKPIARIFNLKGQSY